MGWVDRQSGKNRGKWLTCARVQHVGRVWSAWVEGDEAAAALWRSASMSGRLLRLPLDGMRTCCRCDGASGCSAVLDPDCKRWCGRTAPSGDDCGTHSAEAPLPCRESRPCCCWGASEFEARRACTGSVEARGGEGDGVENADEIPSDRDSNASPARGECGVGARSMAELAAVEIDAEALCTCAEDEDEFDEEVVEVR